jgi:N-carbamoylputrescine amidase
LWELEQPTAAAANGYYVVVPNRVGSEANEFGDEAVNFYGTSYVVDPQGNYVGELGSGSEEELLIRDLDMDLIRTARNSWQFYRDRRPDAYGPIVEP